ncbi:MAG: hypothetical protein WDZ59_00830 [Pirellulales bacterium]
MLMLRRAVLTGSVVLGVLAILSAGNSPADAANLRAELAKLKAHGGPCDCCTTPVCQYNPCIKYVNRRGHHGTCCDSAPPQNVVMVVEDPATCGCAVEVPMCIPACCVGEPVVDSRCGILGRRIVNYEWCCGFRARVVFTHCNDIRVTYFGG